MSWDKTYPHTVLIAVDQFAAAVIFNRPDLTVSTMCWMVRSGNDASLKLAGWQRLSLTLIGDGLEKFWPGHCASASQGDLDRAQLTVESLKAVIAGSTPAIDALAHP